MFNGSPVPKRRGVRVVIGYIGRGISDVWRHRSLWTLVLVSCLMAVSISCPDLSASPLFAQPNASSPATITLPYFNAEGYETTLVTINATDAPIEEPGWINPGCGSYCVVPMFPPHSVTRTYVNRSGIGVLTIPSAIGLYEYVEIVTPHGAPARIGPLFAMDEARVYDLFLPGAYNGGLFIAADTATTATVVETGEVVTLAAGLGAIVSSGSNPVVTVRTQNGAGRVYVFGFVNAHRTGSLQIAPAR